MIAAIAATTFATAASTTVAPDELTASSSATGGTKFLVPILNLLPYSQQSRGNASTYLSGVGGEVTEPGRYEVSVTVTGSAQESETGNGHAQGRVFSTVSSGFENFYIADTEDLPSQPGTVVLQYELDIANPGEVAVQTTLQALSIADGEGNAASVEAEATITDITIEPID